MRNRITVGLLAGVCLLCLLAGLVWVLGLKNDHPSADDPNGDRSAVDRGSRSGSEAPGFDEAGQLDAAQIERWGSSRPRTEGRADASDGGDAGEISADNDRADGARSDVIDPYTLPMATEGRERGINTDFDNDWSPGGEASEWFQPLQSAFEGARPLTPDAYNEILGDYRDNTVDVFKRSGEIGEEQGPEVGIKFLEEYNALVEDYRREAYGESAR